MMIATNMPSKGNTIMVLHRITAIARKLLLKAGWTIETNEKSVIKRIQSDNAKEYVAGAFAATCISLDIVQEQSSAYSHEQMCMIERIHRVLTSRARTSLYHSGASMKYWPLTISYSCWQVNRTPSSSPGMSGCSPYVMLNGHQPDLSCARIWGSDAFVYIEAKERAAGKFVSGATRLTCIGFDSNSKSANLVNMEFPLRIAKRGMGLIKFVENSFTGISDAGADIPSSESLGFDFDLMIIYPPGTVSTRDVTKLRKDLTVTNSDVYAPHSTGTIDLMICFSPTPGGTSEWMNATLLSTRFAKLVFTFLTAQNEHSVKECHPLGSS
jgi:hypothetical protein